MTEKKPANWIWKLFRQDGESLVELLAALLLSSMGLLVLSGMVTAASRTVLGSREKREAYTASVNRMLERGPEGIDAEILVTEIPAERGPGAVRIHLTDETEERIPVRCYLTDRTAGGRIAASYVRYKRAEVETLPQEAEEMQEAAAQHQTGETGNGAF